MNANNTKFESTATADRTAPDGRRGRPDRRPVRILESLRSRRVPARRAHPETRRSRAATTRLARFPIPVGTRYAS
jgi:hypothetical protein